MKGKIKHLEELVQSVEFMRRNGKRIVFTNGCYDLIHVGHVRFLEESKRLGDVLVVAINSDRSVRAIKGAPRPIIQQDERAEVIAALEYVDYVTIFDQNDPLEIIQKVKPDVLVKGGDWGLENIVGRGLVESYGGKVYSLPLVPGVSTTGIISAIVSHFSSVQK